MESTPPRQATYSWPCSSRCRVASWAPPTSSSTTATSSMASGRRCSSTTRASQASISARGVLARALADEDQAGDPHAQERPQIVHLALVEVVGVADQHHLSALGGGLFDGVRHLREERLPGVRDDQAYEVGTARGHRLRDPVRAVAELLDRGEHPLARGRCDGPRPVVDDIADDRGRSTRQPCHIVPRHLGHARQSTRAQPSPAGLRGASDAPSSAVHGYRTAPCDASAAALRGRRLPARVAASVRHAASAFGLRAPRPASRPSPATTKR